MTKISITYLARNLADVVNRVAYQGARFTVLRGRQPVAEVVPVPRGRRLAALPRILASLPRLAEGDAERLGEELEEARRALGGPAGDPWAS